MNAEETGATWPANPPRIVAVRPGEGYCLELKFNDGAAGAVNLEDMVVGVGGVFAPLEELVFFRRVRLCEEAGTVEWPNGVDLCPDVLYSRMTGIPIPFADRDESTPVKASRVGRA